MMENPIQVLVQLLLQVCKIQAGGQAGSSAEHLSGDLKSPLDMQTVDPLSTSLPNHNTEPQREVSKGENLKGP